MATWLLLLLGSLHINAQDFCKWFTIISIYFWIWSAVNFNPILKLTVGNSPNNARPNFGASYGSSFSSHSYEPLLTDELLQARGRLMYHYNLTDFTSITQSKPIHDQPLPFRLPFFGFAFTYVYIQKDGYLGFNKGLLSYTLPLQFPVKPKDPLSQEDPSLIAPWFSQQEIPTSVPGTSTLLRLFM